MCQGVWSTTDHGATWQKHFNNDDSGPVYLQTVAVSRPTNGMHTLLAASPYGGIYRSPDNGANWKHDATPGTLCGRESAVGRRRVPVQVGGSRGELAASLRLGRHRTNYRLARFRCRPHGVYAHALYAAGSEVYYSHDAGSTWQVAVTMPPLNTNDPNPWWAEHLTVSPANKLYLVVGRYDPTPPYRRHSQLWTSADRGVNWQQVVNAPDLPIEGLAAGPYASGGEAIYLSVFDDDDGDDRPIAPDLLVSSDGGQSWRNLGAIPQGPAAVIRPQPGPGQVYVGSVGAWLLAAGTAPTATPNPCGELLLNRSFEYDGAWRIPQTAYPAGRLQDKHSHGYWSMRSGIVTPTANVRSFSDFSQDVLLPAGKTITLRFQRCPWARSRARQTWPRLSRPAAAAAAWTSFTNC